MAIDHVANDDSGLVTRTKVNQAIDKANLVDDKADYTRVASAAANGSHSRPGEPGDHFGTSQYGTPGEITPIASNNKIAAGIGRVARIIGDGVIARRQPYRIEPGARQYRLRVVLKRSVDPSDPDGDAIRIGLAWITSSYSLVTTKILQDISGLEVSDGRQEYTFDFPSVSIPRSADYVRPFVRAFGDDGVTNVEIIEIRDLTDVADYSPDVSALTASMAVLQANFDALSAPAILTFTGDFTVDGSMSGKVLVVDKATAVNVTLPKSLTSFFAPVVQKGLGQVTFLAESGGSLHNYDGYSKTAGPDAEATIMVRGNVGGSAAEWQLGGQLGS